MTEGDPDSSPAEVEPTVPSAVPGRRSWLLPAITGAAGLVIGTVVGFALADGAASNREASASASASAAAASSSSAAASASAAAEKARLAVLPDAVRACGLGVGNGGEVGDNGASLTLDNRGREDSSGLSTTGVFCVLDALNTPDAVLSRMRQTTSMDGRQDAAWDGISVTWSYHPDRGLDMVLTVD